MNTWTVLKDLVRKPPAKKCFYRSLKNGTTDDNGKKLDGYISHEEYLMCEKNLGII